MELNAYETRNKKFVSSSHVNKSNKLADLNPLTAIPTKRSKQTQTIRRHLQTNCLNVFDDFVGLTHKRLSLKSMLKNYL